MVVMQLILLVFMRLVARAERLAQATVAGRQGGGDALRVKKRADFGHKRELSGGRSD